MKLRLFVIPLGVVMLLSSFPPGFGDSAKYGLGTITDLVSDNTNFYYFEIEKGMVATAWMPDTRIWINDGKIERSVSEKLFIYPTELSQDEEHLYFAALSDNCIGQIICDYQDLYKMSKKNGETTILAKDLKSSVHISVDGDSLYVSESSGNIWKINKQDGSKNLVILANEIVMDVTAKDDKIYWIEERSDRNSTISTIGDTQASKILAENLEIPYDLTVQNGNIYWSEIQVKHIKGNFAEFTTIKSFDEQNITLMEFENTSPISTSFGRPNYGPYLVFDNYLFLVNNTNDNSIIHMINMHNSTKYDVGLIFDYDAKYLRTDGNSLFVVGKNEHGFVIDRHTLPITVPEFPVTLSAILVVGFVSAFILLRFSHNLSR